MAKASLTLNSIPRAQKGKAAPVAGSAQRGQQDENLSSNQASNISTKQDKKLSSERVGVFLRVTEDQRDALKIQAIKEKTDVQNLLYGLVAEKMGWPL